MTADRAEVDLTQGSALISLELELEVSGRRRDYSLKIVKFMISSMSVQS